jgi:hypothetical protein
MKAPKPSKRRPRTPAEIKVSHADHRRKRVPSAVRLLPAEKAEAARLAELAVTRGIRVACGNGYRVPDAAHMLGLAVQLGLSAIRAHLEATGLLPICED